VIFENAKFTLTSLRAEGEAIQFGYPLLALCWIATELSLLAMTGRGKLLAMTAQENTAFRSHLGIYPINFEMHPIFPSPLAEEGTQDLTNHPLPLRKRGCNIINTLFALSYTPHRRFAAASPARGEATRKKAVAALPKRRGNSKITVPMILGI